ncbi:MAG: sugar-specific transcriptional regulator TrmB [halophilic archaeon J07HX64]|jgi:Sugar-specific transcriptional regulator TrmB.|nr:MAG: sugar-specific transcriptional regulator TrmB [halophilic archaeon J07HX64]
MSADDTSDGEGETADSDGTETDSGPDVRERLEQEADRAREQFDENIIDLLSWVLDTDTRARIYVHLCQNPDSTSNEVAEGTGLYPSTVDEVLADLHEEGNVTRTKRESQAAGNDPYEYSALPPSELVAEIVGDVQEQLNTVFSFEEYRDGDESESSDEPVTITVREEHDDSVTDGMSTGTSDGHDTHDDSDES